MNRPAWILAALLLVGALGAALLVSDDGDGGAPGAGRVDRDSEGPGAGLVGVAPDGIDRVSVERAAEDDGAAGGAGAEAEPHGVDRIALSGRVLLLGPDGGATPVAGREVTIGPSSPPARATTDAEGRFRITLGPVRDTAAVVYLRAPPTEGSDLISRGRRIDIPAGAAEVTGLDLVLVAAPPIAGRVVDLEGEGLARVVVRRGDESATSGADGRFELPSLATDSYESWVRLEKELEASLADHVLVGVDVPGFADDGAWLPCELVMAPAGEVLVTVEGADGAARPGESVWLRLDADEPLSAAADPMFGFKLPSWSNETDARGVARFIDVPIGPFLEVGVLGRTHRAMTPGAELVAGSTEPLVPIRARRDDALRLRCRAVGEAVIEGVVREPDGAPSAEAYVRVLMDAADRFGERVRTDEEGRFTVRVRPGADATTLDVVAESSRGGRASYSPFGGRVRPDPLCLANAQVALDGRETPYEVALELRAMGTVAGVVVDADGERVASASVTLVPEGGEPAPLLPSGEAATASASGGSFRFMGVPPGRYDVVARSRSHGVVRAGPITHEARDVVVAYGPPEFARVRIVVEGLGAGGRALIAHGTVDGGAGRRAPLGPSRRVTGGAGFPEAARQLSSGVAAFSEGGRRMRVVVESIDASEPTTIQLAPGGALVGLRAWDADGRAYAALGTGPVEVAAGEATLTFAPVPAATLDVEVEGGPPGEWVEVLGDDGVVLGRSRLSSRGTARFAELPSGRADLRIGAAAELDADAPRLRGTVELPPFGAARWAP